MTRFLHLTALLALASNALAQCGSGTPDATVDGETGAFTASKGSEEVYSGADYAAAIQAAVDALAEGERVAVIASGSIGTTPIGLPNGVIFEGCGTIDTTFNEDGRGAIESTGTTGVQIPYLTMTGNPYFGLLFYGVTDLSLGEIEMNLSGGLGIRFHRDEADNSNVSMDTVRVTGAGSHAVEIWNVNGLDIGSVIAKDVGECGLLIQNSINVEVGLVDGENVAEGTGYATLRFANTNGRQPDGGYETSVHVENVVSRGGGRGIFCVSQSGGAVIDSIDLADNGNNAILIENCYNLQISGGTVQGGGEVRISARDEFPVTSDISISLEVNDNTVTENPCGENITWDISGNAALNVC